MTDDLFDEINPQAQAMTRDRLSSELERLAHDLRDVTTPEQNMWLTAIAWRIPLNREEDRHMWPWRRRLAVRKGRLLHHLGSHRWCERQTLPCAVADAWFESATEVARMEAAKHLIAAERKRLARR